MDVSGLTQSSSIPGSPASRQDSSPRNPQSSPSNPDAADAPKRLASDRLSLSENAKSTVLREEGQKLARELTIEDERQISELAARDAEVKAHERAHKAVGGQYTGAISYVYQVGPDGKRYAVGGEVSIDASPVSGDPQATIDKMNVVKSAALAPADPSAQDRRVATAAGQAIAEARLELNEQQREEAQAAREEARELAESRNSDEFQGLAVRTYEGVESSGIAIERDGTRVDTLA